MKLTKIHAEDCEVCLTLGDSAKGIANTIGFDYDEIELDYLANNPSQIRDYVVGYHLDEQGMVEVPIYIITTSEGDIQGSSVVKDIKEVDNLIGAWKKWESSQKQ
tara:strand:+ start:1325 stop:1639 length:315 start_codon:yes stop_codon:yes gene_type:complete